MIRDEIAFQAGLRTMARLDAKEREDAAWYAKLLQRASKQTTDFGEAMLIAEAAFSMQPKEVMPSARVHSNGERTSQVPANNSHAAREPVAVSVVEGAAFAFDIFNKKAQGILNRALKASSAITEAARKELRRIASNQNRSQMAMEVVQFVAKYRLQLTKLLGATNLASLLEGASEVARRMPPLPPLGGQAPPPPTLPLDEAEKLVREIKRLKPHEQEEAIYRLPPDQQGYVRAAISSGAPPSHPLRITPPREDEPEYTQYPIIEQAAKTLGEKNLVNSWTFHRLDDAARSKAFTVTGVDAQATLGKIRDAIVQNIQEGADFETFRENIVKSVDEGTFLSDSHLEVVFRTNIQTAFSDGQMAVLSHPFIRSGFPYASYEAIHDDRTRPDHLALETLGIEGTNVYRIDDPVFQLFRPSWDFGCRCGWIALTIRQAAERGVTEAIRWLETGVQPYPPAYVDMPPFQPPASFKRAVSTAPLSIQMSLENLSVSLGQQLRDYDDCKPNKNIDWELWEECKAIIPPEWYEAQEMATKLLASYGIPTKPEDFPFFLGEVRGKKVSIIDGDKEMLTHDMDFTQGGNGYEDPKLCKKDEIVLDNRMCLPLVSEFPPITYHESDEAPLMAEGWDYDDAHEDANPKEKYLRLNDPVGPNSVCPTCGGKTKTDGESRWCQDKACEWTSTSSQTDSPAAAGKSAT